MASSLVAMQHREEALQGVPPLRFAVLFAGLKVRTSTVVQLPVGGLQARLGHSFAVLLHRHPAPLRIESYTLNVSSAS